MEIGNRVLAIMILGDFLNFILPVSMAVNPSCDFFQSMQMGQEYYIYNREYPNLYTGGTSCRWVARSPPSTKIVLTCEEINLPSSNNCQQDRLAISLTGNSTLEDSHNYCGFGTVTLISDSNSLAIGLFTSPYSAGGRFMCTVLAIQSEEPPTTTARPNSCDCGWRHKRRIVGGVETGINEFPYMAGLIDLPKRQVHCGAAIISKRHALTAAHCLVMMEARNFALLVGDHDLTTGFETTAAKLYPLESFTVHPMYNNLTKQHDIGIIQTRDVMEFSAEVGPICLPFRYTDATFEGFPVTVLGWGTIEFSGPTSDVLLAANVSIVSNLECQRKLPREQIMYTQACTYAPGKDACQYDSGGPLIWFDSTTSNRYQLIALVSYGLACGSELPAVNTRVSNYLSWIVRSTSGTTYCIK